MHIVKLLSLVFLAVYLIVVGFAGIGVPLTFVPPVVVGFLALVSGILFLVWGVKSCCCCDSCEKPPFDKP